MFFKEIFVEDIIRSYEAEPTTIAYKKLDLFNPIFYANHLTYEAEEAAEPTEREPDRKVA